MPGLGSPLPHLTRTGPCAGTGPTPTTSAPGLGQVCNHLKIARMIFEDSMLRQSQALLQKFIPPSVISRLRCGQTTVADKFDEV